MSLFDALGIGRTGVTAQSRAISVTSQNIANVNTPGYSRLRPVFDPIAPANLPGGFPTGGGVHVVDIERVVDQALEAALQQERSGFAFDRQLEAGLSRIEGIFEELSGAGLGNAVNEFFSALNDLATNPSDATVRVAVIERAQALVDLVHDADRRIDRLQLDANADIRSVVDEVNELTRDIADLNQQIALKEVGGTGSEASSLRDERAKLLSELGEKIDITAFERPDGQVSVFTAGGFLLVDSEQSGVLEVRTGAPSNPAFFDVYHRFDGSVNGPITSTIRGGEIGADLRLRDDRIAHYRDTLDEFAFTLARRINEVHYPQPAPAFPAGAYGLDDGQQRRFFVDGGGAAVAEGADFALIGGAAARLEIHADILANPRHIAAGAETRSAVAPALLGAAASDNRNALLLAGLEFADTPFYAIQRNASGVEIPPGAANGSLGTLSGFFDGQAGALGAELRGARRSVTQAELSVAELEQRRGSLSGVSLDEEVTNLVRFEKAYQASARVIQTANELLDLLLRI